MATKILAAILFMSKLFPNFWSNDIWQSSDVVETATFETETWLKFRDRDWDRDFIKNSETDTRDMMFETETNTRDFKIFAFCRNFFDNVVITSESSFFFISGIFPTCFVCFLPENTTKKSHWIIEILINHLFAIFEVSRPETFEIETETRTETFKTETET